MSADYGSTQDAHAADAAVTSKTPLLAPSNSNTTQHPDQPNGNSNTSTVVGWDVVAYPSTNSYPLLFRAAPWRLLLRDLRFIAGNIGLVPWMFLPITKGKDITFTAILAQIVFFLISIVLTVALLAGAVVGLPPFIVSLLLLLLFCKVANWLQGRRVRHSQGTASVANADKEAWFFVNGVATTGTAAQETVTRLQELFHRPVSAVLNRSYGLLFDLLESIIQRDLLYITSDIRVGYNSIRRAVLNPDKERVVIIAHSQGGIIATAWVDQLLCDFPNTLLSKVEVYTFASAANHFSRPTTDAEGADQPFAHVEHFANENDFVARFGVLGYAPAPNEADEGDDPQPRTCSISDKLDAAHDLPRARGDYAGRIFCRRNHTGHPFLSFYINSEDSILDDPYVRQHSHLVKYLNGGEAL